MRVADESLPIAWQIGEITVILFVSAWLGLAYLKVGRLTEARRVIDRAAEHGQASRDATPFALTYITIAAALARLAAGEADAALETARRALGFADRSRFRLEQGAAHRVLGQAYAATGHRAEADAAFRHSLEILEAIRSWPELGQTLLAYGQFQLGTLGTDPAQGHAFIERARAIFDEIGAPGWLAEAEAALGAR
jgi:tetratricopeptide (TPR) repeat protein